MHITVFIIATELILKFKYCRDYTFLKATTNTDIATAFLIPSYLLLLVANSSKIPLIDSDLPVKLETYWLEWLRIVWMLQLFVLLAQVLFFQALNLETEIFQQGDILQTISWFMTTSVVQAVLLAHTPHVKDSIHTVGFAMYWAFISLTTIGYGDFASFQVLPNLCGVIAVFMLVLMIHIVVENVGFYLQFHGRTCHRKEDNCNGNTIIAMAPKTLQ